ncbi:ubiquitin C-terminal hydrolase L3 [Aaosphaeria arxii CBS 175.79]|uniref:Ubiquitin carboxyl-terminal hydrolase n=1 Tax=Aaosphaeria arxii CBS 175.79 TaxID=1450172 RepID=A0A6A5XMA6_9PLEO|nr:ubiquitin C-terminal hydrolase L3 [Aaosphaeria arxii CBS 175.79]KAF2013977.1 ubiquitin C-terminal hydrolase L3 [Aaosphaeria arxii CBS 175.79]
MGQKTYRKHFIPLESNPDIFTELVHSLGVSESLGFQDVLSLDDPDLLAFIPRPVFALILVFPCADDYDQRVDEENANSPPYDGSGPNEEVVFWKQTIHNACGLYALLHAVSNGDAKDHINSGSILSNLLDAGIPLKPFERAMVLEDSKQLASAYESVARKGDSIAPENPEDEVNFHYICFVKSSKTGNLFQMNGDLNGPIDLGPMKAEDDVLSEKCLQVIHNMVKDNDSNIGFSLMALTSS